MAYEVTATRKRPQDFEKLVGQEFVVSTLENALKEERIAHAYLFSGPRGVGKTSSARLLAKALNCKEGPKAHPCGVCDSCREIKEGTSVDVIEIDGASNTSVENIRRIKEEVMYPPQSSRYKIYIIDEVHMLSTSAFNALLKTIEEPPEYLIFIFATTELQKVPQTIRSRCQQFKFQLIDQETIKNQLAEAAKEAGIEADEDALFWISKEATGSMRDAYTLFDQVASFSSDKITLKTIKEKLNLAGFSTISEIVSSSINQENEKAFLLLTDLFNSGVSSEQIIKDSAEFFRTLLLYKNGIKRQDLLSESISSIPQDLVALLSKEQIEGALRSFLDLYRDIKYSISPRLEVELLFSRLSNLPYLSSPEALIKKLEKLKEGIQEGKVVIKKKVDKLINTESEEEDKNKEKEEVKSQTISSTNLYKEEEKENLTTKNSLPSMYFEEDDEEKKADLALRKDVIKRLEDEGLKNESSAFQDVTALYEDEGKIKIEVKKSFSLSLLKKNEKKLIEILSVLLHRKVSIILSLKADEKDGKEINTKLKQIQNIFGGKVNFLEKTEIKYESEENNNGSESESFRNDEIDAGFDDQD